jgi:hypothetical protein
MDGWWTLAAGNPHVTRASSRKEELADGIAVLTPKPVLMDRSPDPPAAATPTASEAQATRRVPTAGRGKIARVVARCRRRSAVALLPLSGERRGEEAASDHADERAPVHHSIT